MNELRFRLPEGTKVVLASASPRRREILEQIHLPFTVVTSGAEENLSESLAPSLLVQSLAFLKASDVAKNQPEETLVIGADTVVAIDSTVLGKPKDEAEAIEMLSRLSGRHHSVLTGVCAVRCRDGKAVSIFEETKVFFKELTEQEIASYVKTGEPMDKAGAYGIQGLGGLFVEKIEGDYYNVVGLPLSHLGKLLQEEFDFELIWEV